MKKHFALFYFFFVLVVAQAQTEKQSGKGEGVKLIEINPDSVPYGTATIRVKEPPQKNAAVAEQSAKEEPKVFDFVEQMPEFPDGDGALMKFLQQNVRYPKYEVDHNIQGKVIITMVILEDGGIGDVRVVRSVSKGLDEEAVRVVKMLPKFKPAQQYGKPVAVYYSVPLVFKLTDTGTEPKDKSKKKRGKKS